jgi:DNA (cytosine-5)-methyltransferase 1
VRAVSAFAGVGGLDLALEHHGIEVVAQIENDPHCLAVLERHWPSVARYGDITEVDWHEFLERHGPVDLVAAGFPCQPTSQAGRRKAQADPRWLWPEVARCLRVLRPPYVFLENTLGLLSRGFGDVLGDLFALGFDAEWDCFQAADVGAPHERDRVFVLAYRPRAGRGRPRVGTVDAGQAGRGDALADADGEHGPASELERDPVGRLQLDRGAGASDRAGQVADPISTGLEVLELQPDRHQRTAAQRGRDERQGRRAQPGLGGDAPGLPRGLDGHRWPAPPGPEQYPWEPPRTVGRNVVRDRGRRVKALGNAVVPQQGALAFGVLWNRMLKASEFEWEGFFQ